MSDIRPWIARDIENFEECLLDKMLKDLLMDCTDKSPEWFDEARKTHLFEECLKKVLPICNGADQAKNKDIQGKSYQVKDNLAALYDVMARLRDEC